MFNLLGFYHALPHPLKVLAASFRGYYLRWWRYGPETERLVYEALERETWTPERWKAWQDERLGYILQRARFRVPYYREYWDRRQRSGDRSSWEYLENWPVLKKESLRANPRAFVAEDCNLRWIFNIHTSGTTGKPLSLRISRKALRYWYALSEARWRRWYGLSRHDRWAILGGQLVVSFEQSKPPFWVWNKGLNQLYLSSYHLSPDFIPAYVKALHRYDVVYVWGYASSLYSLAELSLEKGLELPRVKAVISNAEPLYDFQREAIHRAFKAPVYDTYGMSEMVGGASECLHGTMHLWPDAGILEILADDSDEPVPPGQIGRMVWTGLVNPDMPLIRYEIGDRGAVAGEEIKCACGRTLLVLLSVEGRMDDVLVTPDGRRIGRLDPVFKVDIRIREAQIIQEALDRLRVLVVPAPGYDNRDGELIVKRLKDRVGDVEVILEPVDNIPKGPNGKFRAVVSKINTLASIPTS